MGVLIGLTRRPVVAHQYETVGVEHPGRLAQAGQRPEAGQDAAAG